MRCTITNGSNGPIDLVTANGSLTFLAAPTLTVPLTGSIPAGGTRSFPVWSGAIADGPSSASCSGSIEYPDAIGGGGGTGGGIIPITGTIEATPAPAPGRTVTVSGDSVFPPVISSFRITLDGVEVPDSPRTITGPDFDFSALVVIPAGIAPGTHTIAVQGTFSGRDITYAQWQFEVPTLAATGVDAGTPALLATLAVATGGVLLLLRRRRRAL
jgi:LPXTG-motif cell wall-anchored protein